MRPTYDDVCDTLRPRDNGMYFENDRVTRPENFEDATIKHSYYFRRQDESQFGIHGFIERYYHVQARKRCERECDLRS